MKFLLLIALFTCMLGCTSVSVVCPADLKKNIKKSENFHEKFLFWPNVAEELNDVAEGALGNAYFQLMNSAADRGQKDWIKNLSANS